MRLFRRGNKGDRADENPARRKPDPYEVYLGLRGIPLGEKGGPKSPLKAPRSSL